jgi:methionyl-tRNA formyltransferase
MIDMFQPNQRVSTFLNRQHRGRQSGTDAVTSSRPALANGAGVDPLAARATPVVPQYYSGAAPDRQGEPVGGERPTPESGRLRILFVTADDPLYAVRFFDILFTEYPEDEFEICGISIDRAFHEPMWKTLRRMYAFYGFLGGVRQGWRAIDARVHRRSIRSLAESKGVPIIQARSVNDRGYIDRVRAIAPDVIVSVAAPEIFKAELLSVPRLGCINIHSGRLPTYRGMMPTFWQMQRGEPSLTITVHRMVQKLDAGDVLGTQNFPIGPSDSLDQVIKGAKCEGARLMLRVLRDLRAGLIEATPLDMQRADYFSFPKREDVQQFRRQGRRLL